MMLDVRPNKMISLRRMIDLSSLRWLPVAAVVLLVCEASRGRAVAEDSLLAGSTWKLNGLATPRFRIQGTSTRNNPLRRRLLVPYSADELFVRFRLRYQATSIDSPEQSNGEFFVLWLDAVEGNDASTHSNGVPNIGLHVADDGNRFMVRYASGGEQFGPPLMGDRDFLIVGRLWKSKSGEDQPFDHWDLWVDPQPEAEFTPQATTKRAKSISSVGWIGLSTGAKTEIDDVIEVWDIELARDWRRILGLPPQSTPDATEHPVSMPKTVAFGQDVFPILKAKCYDCHSGDDAEEGVRLDVLDEVLNQTAPRDSANSKLFQLVAKGEMPPDDRTLSDGEQSIVKAWINEGLDWDEELLPTPIPQTDHWAFQPIKRPDIPKVKRSDWVRTPIDAFVAQKHEILGIQPTPLADFATLRRRISLDLLGLPPADLGSEQHDLQSAGEAANEREGRYLDSYVQRLLSHPSYGERWGRHWLDVARWAESNGHQHNRDRPHSWRYRDWVVNAFTANKPFDDFLREQIAGDELDPYRRTNIVATGFLSAARYSGNELDKEIQRNDILVDIVNTTSKAFLGLTMECAQCHTHKFDPISIRDYYRFQAFFTQGQPGNIVLTGAIDDVQQLIDQRWTIFDSVQDRLITVKRKQGFPEPILITPSSVVRGMRADEKARYEKLNDEIAEYEQSWSFYSPVSASTELAVAPHQMRWPLPRDRATTGQLETALLIRGDVKSPGPTVQPGWPAVFGGLAPLAREQRKRPRTALAAWMTDVENPLPARVWVNRIWQWHFGRGLVETSGDFGTQGAAPSHPDLLDYLASELVASDWDTNRIHLLILNSATYRQSNQYSKANAAADPENRSLWRWTPRRLEAEAIRDCILEVAGLLDRRGGGPSVDVKSKRRSLYLKQHRDRFPHQQIMFDSADGIRSCSRRRVSTSPLQPLWLLNSELMRQASEQFANRAGSVAMAFEIAMGRTPAAEEIGELQQLADDFGLASACLAILNSSEFLYIP